MPACAATINKLVRKFAERRRLPAALERIAAGTSAGESRHPGNGREPERRPEAYRARCHRQDLIANSHKRHRCGSVRAGPSPAIRRSVCRWRPGGRATVLTSSGPAGRRRPTRIGGVGDSRCGRAGAGARRAGHGLGGRGAQPRPSGLRPSMRQRLYARLSALGLGWLSRNRTGVAADSAGQDCGEIAVAYTSQSWK